MEEQTPLSLIKKKIADVKSLAVLRATASHLLLLKDLADRGRLSSSIFKSGEEYLAFVCGKLFIQDLRFLPVIKDPELDSETVADEISPIIEAVHLSLDERLAKKEHILNTLTTGDALHLIVVSVNEEHYELIALNKYGDKRRLLDLNMKFYLLKGKADETLRCPLKKNDLLRAVIMGRIKNEGSTRKRYVSVDSVYLKEELKTVKLGLVVKSEIPFYPESYADYKNFASYYESQSRFKQPSSFRNDMNFLAIDPLLSHCFHGAFANWKAIEFKYEDLRAVAKEKIQKAIPKLTEALTYYNQGDFLEALEAIKNLRELALENEISHVLQGMVNLKVTCGKPSHFVQSACRDFLKCLELNPSNQEAKSLYSQIMMESAARYLEEGNKDSHDKISEMLTDLLGESEKLRLMENMYYHPTEVEEDETLNIPAAFASKKAASSAIVESTESQIAPMQVQSQPSSHCATPDTVKDSNQVPSVTSDERMDIDEETTSSVQSTSQSVSVKSEPVSPSKSTFRPQIAQGCNESHATPNMQETTPAVIPPTTIKREKQ